MKKLDELKELGLDENEIKIYLACLSEGGSNVLEISKKSGLIRTTVYGVLQSLLKKGLVAKINKDGIKFFSAASPIELLNILDQKKEKINIIIPELEKIRSSFNKIYSIESFEGKNGVKTITNDIISIPNQIVKVIGAGKKWVEFSETFSMIYYRKKKENNVKTKTILSNLPEEKEFIKNKEVKNSEFKFLKRIDVTKTATFIYHDKVAFVSYEENPRGFIIKDKEFNEIQNIFFDNLWKIAK
ncbi:MAG: helix-turn-helix domain-containing protein [Candidatus Pacearchaeota archaeon]